MAFNEMIQEILGIPGMNRGLAATKINEAFAKIQSENVWSFQCQTGGFLTPGLLGNNVSSLLSPGTISVVPFTTTITADAVATAAWTAPVPYPPILTQQQIRIPYFSIYSIIAQGSAPTVAYLTINTAGSGQTPGSYLVNGSGGGGTGAQALITVNANGTVILPPVVVNQGSGYTSAPTFTLAAGGTPATFTATLNATVTIDRPWTDLPQVNSSYMIYQCYYAMPPGWKRLFAFTDLVNNNDMNYWGKTQQDLAREDPERQIFDQPYYVVPYQMDTRQGSATYGQFLVELWPGPITQLPYSYQVQCNWPALKLPTDTVPYPLNDEIVKFRTYQILALWKESQKGDDQERGSGANWQFLWKAHQEEYRDQLRELRIMDRHLMDLYFQKARQEMPFGGEPYANVNGTINVGGWNG